ncbi:vanadium-dependent haloperoxidase [Clostridium botulinum C]|uniref:Vanadium-dependent haloperoxidase n=3 Tax=Clostridium botulinum TaxID=1491 RepID=A0A9Q4TKS6_CLOBO|nr:MULTISPECIES: vanadium-dependent haloperoxidase [Clostridium]EGO86849.1 phosphoesterase PA-phosphatase [Clostridium botulinum C str. Stockholm]AYF54877.1 phosphatase PAP2 family protein [Clostridium novyi]EES90970.1 phosphoesterase, PA-phosphatase related [Clostridium botulinum D str. 1873]MCD3195942.1 vanadium-dependent haloperoxidase [Clostridium botulinum C]MCD3199062.1 vanadium-dependent haloperoxidase [Clostridium botulinum C]
MSKFRWNEIPYPGENFGPIGEGEDAGSWPLKFFERNDNDEFYDLKGNKIAFEIQTPNDTMSFGVNQLNQIKTILSNLTDKQKETALYWSSDNLILLYLNNVITLLKNYRVSTMDSARILSIMGDAFNDAMVLTYYFKYKFQIPRPIQIDSKLNTYLQSSYDPSYPVGHAVIAGMASTVLSYFFPDETDQLSNTAKEAAMSKVYAGIHYPIDAEQGLRLGKQIGSIIINSIKDESNSFGNSINNIYRK